MISTAYYSRLDARNPAAFSRSVIHRLLRRQLGFRGVVISDDLGNAGQVAAWSPGARAVRFLGAGGDLVLTVNPATLPAMYRAVQRAPRIRPASGRGSTTRCCGCSSSRSSGACWPGEAPETTDL